MAGQKKSAKSPAEKRRSRQERTKSIGNPSSHSSLSHADISGSMSTSELRSSSVLSAGTATMSIESLPKLPQQQSLASSIVQSKAEDQETEAKKERLTPVNEQESSFSFVSAKSTTSPEVVIVEQQEPTQKAAEELEEQVKVSERRSEEVKPVETPKSVKPEQVENAANKEEKIEQPGVDEEKAKEVIPKLSEALETKTDEVKQNPSNPTFATSAPPEAQEPVTNAASTPELKPQVPEQEKSPSTGCKCIIM